MIPNTENDFEQVDKRLKRIERFLFAFMVFILLIIGGVIYYAINRDQPEQTQTNNKPKTNIKGPAFDIPAPDSINYDQHPQKKCWHLNYENR